MASMDESHPVEFARDVHSFLASLDPARWPQADVGGLQKTLGAHKQGGARVLRGWAALPDQLAADARLRQATEALASSLHETEVPGPVQGDWLALRDRVAPLYEALVTALRRHGQRVETLHPTNWKRTVFHVGSGLAVVAAFEHVLTPTSAVVVAGAFCAWAWSLELARKHSTAVNDVLMRFFRPVAREHERYRVNSSTWYGTALLVIAVTAPSHAGMLGVLALAVGDPAAAWVGRRWGRVRVVRGKSAEGSVAFVVVSTLACMAFLAAYAPGLAPSRILALAVAASVAGAVTELVTTIVDDNFAVPLVAAWTALGVAALLG